MEIDLLRQLIDEGRYEVNPRLVAEAIVDRMWIPEPPPAYTQRRQPSQLGFDPKVVPPPHHR